MLARGKGGRIINIASISALIANRGIGGRDYETGKAAVLHFTRCAAADWAPHGITVNAICPGLFMTDINRQWNERRPDVIAAFVQNVPMGRPGEPDEIGPLAVFLASDASSYVTGRRLPHRWRVHPLVEDGSSVDGRDKKSLGNSAFLTARALRLLLVREEQ